jgi:hypothetical protein
MSIKLSRVLPPVNVALAVGLLQWGRHSRAPVVLDTMWVPTPTLLCFGINAPAFRISRMLEQLVSSLRSDFLSKIAYSTDIVFLIVVAIFWYLVGQRSDYSRLAHGPVEAAHGRKLAWKLLVLLYGLNLLIVICLHNVLFTNPKNGTGGDNNFLGDLIFQGLWLIWSFILIIIPARDLLRAVHRRKEAVFVPDSTAIPK